MKIEFNGYIVNVGSTKRGKRGKGRVGPTVRAEVFLRDKFICHICKQECNYKTSDTNHPCYPTIDHLIPRSEGGSDDVDNLKTACASCNNRRESKPLDDLGLIYQNKHKKPEGISRRKWAVLRKQLAYLEVIRQLNLKLMA